MDVAKHLLPAGSTLLGRKVEYLPPSTEQIRRYSYLVSRHLYGDTVAKTNFTELCQGFTEFVSVIVRIQTNARNRSEKHVK